MSTHTFGEKTILHFNDMGQNRSSCENFSMKMEIRTEVEVSYNLKWDGQGLTH